MMRGITTAWVIMFIALTCQVLFDTGWHTLHIYPYLTFDHKFALVKSIPDVHLKCIFALFPFPPKIDCQTNREPGGVIM